MKETTQRHLSLQRFICVVMAMLLVLTMAPWLSPSLAFADTESSEGASSDVLTDQSFGSSSETASNEPEIAKESDASEEDIKSEELSEAPLAVTPEIQSEAQSASLAADEDSAEPLAYSVPDDAQKSGISGTCTWYITSATDPVNPGQLVIYPTDGVSGKLDSYTLIDGREVPWLEKDEEGKTIETSSINSVKVTEGVLPGTSTMALFKDCVSAKNIELPEGFGKNTGSLSYMFFGCKSLTSLAFPDGFGSLATGSMSSMFQNCTVLEELTLPSGFGSKAIEMPALFRACGALKSLSLPAQFGSQLKANANGASSIFEGCSALTSLEIPVGFGSQITTAPMRYLFRDCTSLTSLNLPEGFLSEATAAQIYQMFYGCTALTSLELPAGFAAKATGPLYDLFKNCTALKELKLPEGFASQVTSNSIYGMFENCTSLEALNLPAGFASKVTTGNMNSLFRNCTSLTEIKLPAGFGSQATKDMYYMFDGCTKLTLIDLPAGFGSKATGKTQMMFQNCTSLKKLELPEGFGSQALQDMNGMFENCTSLEELILPAGFASSIESRPMSNMFRNCTMLKELVIPEGFASKLTSAMGIMGGLFYGCTALENLTLPSGFGAKMTEGDMDRLFNGCSSLVSLKLPDGFASLATGNMYGMFSNCTALKSLELPEEFAASMETGDLGSLFSRCESLESLKLPVNFGTKVTTASMFAMFLDCKSLESITLPEGFAAKTTTGSLEDMFSGCTSLKSLALPDGFGAVYEEGSGYMFKGCSSLASLELPVGFMSQPTAERMDYMFQDCVSLASLVLPEGFGVEATGSATSMFSGCTALASLELPHGFASKMTGKMQGMFQNCSALEKLKLSTGFGAQSTGSAQSMFSGCSALTELELPEGFGQSVSSIAQIFNDCTSIRTLTVPASFTNLNTSLPAPSGDAGDDKFYSGNWLTSDGIVLAHGQFPASTADTYTAQALGHPQVAIVGTLKAGEELKAEVADGNDFTITYQWARSATADGVFEDIADATTEGYITSEADEGKYLSCTIQYEYTGLADIEGTTSAIVGPVAITPPPVVEVTVKFVTNNDQKVADQVIDKGTKASEPEALTKAGHTFSGWYTDSAFKTKWDFSNVINADMTLYAKWTENPVAKVTVKFVTNNDQKVADQVINKGTKATTPKALAKAGYTFGGWYTDTAFKTMWNFSKAVNADMTLYAKWTEKPIVFSGFTRLAGTDRYKTMQSILKAGFAKGSTDTVIIATGANYPDALAASGLAGLNNAPIVLTAKESLVPEAKAEIERIGAKKALIIGSSAAVSSNVDASLKSLGLSVKRIEGATRIETAIEIYKAGGNKWGKTAIVASGINFPDALSISSFSYANNAPIFLTDGNKVLTDQSISAIKTGGFTEVIVVGSDAAVSNKVESQLKGIKITRLAGPDRYATSLKIAEYGAKNGLKVDGIAVATGANFPDALAGAALCGKSGSVIMLVNDNPAAKEYVGTFLKAHKASIQNGFVLGSEVVVSASLKTYVENCCK